MGKFLTGTIAISFFVAAAFGQSSEGFRLWPSHECESIHINMVREDFKNLSKQSQEKALSVFGRLSRIDKRCFNKKGRANHLYQMAWTAAQVGKNYLNDCKLGGLGTKDAIQCTTKKEKRWIKAIVWLKNARKNAVESLSLQQEATSTLKKKTTKVLQEVNFWLKVLRMKKRCVELRWCRHLTSKAGCEKQYNDACGNL